MTKQTPQLMTLANGLRLVLWPMTGLKSVTVLAMVGVGSRFETKSKMGISHFLEHLPFKGTANYPTAMDVARAIDDVGGKHNAFTSKDYTGYWVKVASQHTDLALDMVSDLLLTAKLREDEIEREKGVIVEEINMYEDNPQFKVSNLFDELVFEGSGLAWDTAGTAKTVTSLTREDFVRHWDTWYDPKNTVVGLVGDESALKKLKVGELEAYFLKGEARKGGGKRDYGVPFQEGPRLKVFYKKTEQAHYHIGFPSIGRKDPGRYALAVLTTLMGGNSSSRLFNEIREKRGLAYYAYASVDMFDEAGSFYSLAGVALSKIEEAIQVTMGEFERARAGDIPVEEVKRSKEYLIGKMSLDLEDSSSMANMIMRKLLLENELVSPAEVLEKIKAVKVEDVKAMAKKVIDLSKVNLAVVGPYKKRDEFEKLIG